MFVGAALATLVVGSGVVYLALKGASWGQRRSEANYIGRIVYEVGTSMGGKHDVRFTLSVPFRSAAQKNALMQKMPSINRELSVCGNRPDVARSVEQKDLHTLRKHIVSTVHGLTGVPTEAGGTTAPLADSTDFFGAGVACCAEDAFLGGAASA